MIPKKHHHYATLEIFRTKKFSADPGDTSWTYGGDGEVFPGEPDISWRSLVFIKDPGLIATHGKIYDATGEADRLKSPISLNGSPFDGTKDVITETWGATRTISIKGGSAVEINGGEDIQIPLPDLLDTRVTKDSKGREIIETYSTFGDLEDAINGLDNFFIYSGDDDTNPTLTTPPADSWITPEERGQHAGDYYVTTSGRIFVFEEDPEVGWRWKEITDYYLYNCLEEIRDLRGRLGYLESWEGIQTAPETGEIYVLGRKGVKPYLDVVSCPGSVRYRVTSDTNIYLPFSCGGAWTRTRTTKSRVSSLLTFSDLSGVSGKSIIILNEPDSLGSLTFILGNSPSGVGLDLTLAPGEACILTLRSDIGEGGLVFYWEATGPGGFGLTSGWS